MAPNERDAITGMPLSPSQTVFPTVVYRRFTAHWEHAAAATRRAAEQPGPHPGPAAARPRRRPICSSTSRTWTRCCTRPHSMHFHGVHYQPSSDGAYVPGFSGRDGDVKPGQTWTYKLTAGHDSVGVWPYHDHSPSMDGLDRRRHVRDALDPRRATSARPTASSRSSSRRWATSRRSTGARSSATRRSSTSKVGQTRPVGRDGDGLRAPHLPRPRPPLARRRRHRRATRRPSARPRRFRIRWREEDPGTWLYHCHVEAPHDGRDDRHLPGQAPMRRLALAARRRRCARAGRAGGAGAMEHGTTRRHGQAAATRVDRLRRLRAAARRRPRRRHGHAGRTTASARTRSPPTTAPSTPGGSSAATTFTRTLRHARRRAPTTARCTRSCAARSTCTTCCSTRADRARRARPRRTCCSGRAALRRGHRREHRGRPRRRLPARRQRRRWTTDGTFTAAVVPTTTATYRAVAGRRGEPAGAAARARPHGRGQRARGRGHGVIVRAHVDARRRRARPSSCSCASTSTSAGGRWPARSSTATSARALLAAPARPRTPRACVLTLRGRRDAAGRQPDAARRAGALTRRPGVGAAYISGEGGIRVSPLTSGIRIATSSTKHHDQSSPGSSERMIGCSVAARVRGRVLVGRVVAAADVAALEADAQVQPLAAVAQAVLAAGDRLGQLE